MNNYEAYNTSTVLLKISLGEVAAFNALFEQYRNQLFTYLYKITKSTEASEEMVLDVFLKIWNGREALTEIENFDAFLFRIAHNKAIDFLRAFKKKPEMQQQVWEAMQEPPSGEYADNQLLLKNAETIISEAVAQLSPQRQKVFYLHNYHNLTNVEIAHHLNLSKNTVRNHLATSVEFIRKFLSDHPGTLVSLFLLLK